MRSNRCLVILSGLILSAAGPVPANDQLLLVLKPFVGDKPAVSGILVREEVHRGGKPRPIDLSLPETLPGVPLLPASILDLSATAASATVDLKQTTELAADGSSWHHWRSSGSIASDVVISYQVEVRPANQSGPPFGLKAAGAGVAGNTSSFLLLPEGMSSHESRIRWDLSSLPPTSIGVITAGRGARSVAGPPKNLLDQWLLAGPVAARRDANKNAFTAYMVGTPPFEAQAFLDWTARAYDTLSSKFGYLGAPQYTLLVRAVPGPSYATGTAAERGGGSLVTVGTEYHRGQDLGSIRAVTFHEMTHDWVGHLAEEKSWFSEGLTVFFSTILPCQTGLVSDTECAAAINQSADAYYSSEARNWSQQRIDAAPFSKEEVRTVPYGRGMLYFADLNARIRAKSHGHRNLLIALRPLFTARRDGHPLNMAIFETMVRRELGNSAVASFRRAVIDGSETIVPASDAFGPNLHRVLVPYPVGAANREGYHWIAK